MRVCLVHVGLVLVLWCDSCLPCCRHWRSNLNEPVDPFPFYRVAAEQKGGQGWGQYIASLPSLVQITFHPWPFVSDVAIFVLKRDVKLQLTRVDGTVCRLTSLRCHRFWSSGSGQQRHMLVQGQDVGLGLHCSASFIVTWVLVTSGQTNYDEILHHRGGFFMGKVYCDTLLFLWPVSCYTGQQHAGRSWHQGHWDRCSVACGKILTYSSSRVPLPIGGSRCHLIHSSWTHASPCPKWHLDRFSRYGMTDSRYWQTDRQTMLVCLWE